MIRDLKIEYRKNPIGIDMRPRFSWKLESERENVVQSGYRIQVTCKEKQVWDSGRVENSQSVLVPYEGEELEPMTEYQVLVY